jgi:hypothetical protein
MHWLTKAIVGYGALAVVVPSIGQAARGVVLLEDGNCAIVETSGGFSVLEWYGGTLFMEGNLLIGDLESYGMKDIYDIDADQEIRVWISDYWMSWEDAIDLYYSECK